ncbi:hypothetical protein DC20_13125 [Rufibacter tibetensis]|uniref:Uncharacterized protein n=1 Tax=Rufibacter tibetensis TaxID=512763 RepID=A0A0P0C8D5_9BACT|nr:hypothetical protein DC20_13125 [Rufibacter tibetensis]
MATSLVDGLRTSEVVLNKPVASAKSKSPSTPEKNNPKRWVWAFTPNRKMYQYQFLNLVG